MLEPCECTRIIDKARDRYKFDHRLMYIAFTNAIGGAFSKGYKYNDVFEKDESQKEVTEEERQKMKEYLQNW